MSNNRSKWSIPLGLFGMLVLVTLIEAWLSISGKFTTDVTETWRTKGDFASHEAVECDLLCFGDSLIEFGIVPKVFEKRLHKKTFNLALPAGTTDSSYLLLKRALDSGARPSRVIVNFMPYHLSPPQLDLSRQRLWPELAGFREVSDLAWARRDIDFGVTNAISLLFTSYRARPEIRANIIAALQSRSTVAEETRLFVTKWNLRSNRGALIMPDQARKAEPWAILPHIEINERRRDAVGYIDRFIELAAARGITVYWLIPPISVEYQTHCDSSGSAGIYTKFVQECQSRFPNLIVVDGRHAGYLPSLFADAMHLTRQGATALSEDMAEVLTHPAVPNRWVELARYRERPFDKSMEDILESRIAIGLVPRDPALRR